MKKSVAILMPLLLASLGMAGCSCAPNEASEDTTGTISTPEKDDSKEESTPVDTGKSATGEDESGEDSGGKVSEDDSKEESGEDSKEDSEESEDTVSGEDSGEESSGDEPISTDFALFLNGEEVPFAGVSYEPGEDTWLEQYEATITAEAGDKVVFKKDGEVIRPGASGETNNILPAEENGEMVIREAVEDEAIYLKVYENGYDVWLGGYKGTEPEANHVYSIIGSLGEDNWGVDHLMEVKNGVASIEFTFAAGEEFKIRVDRAWEPESVSYGYPQLVSAPEGAFTANNTNIKVVVGGTYTVSLDIEKTEITITGDQQITHAYSVIGSFGGDNWDADHAMTLENGVATINLTFAQGDLFKIRVDGQWATTYGYSHIVSAPQGGFKAGAEENNIEVVASGTYKIALAVASGEITITSVVAG